MGCNFSGSDLAGADLARADLAKATLTNADLAGADLTRADLKKTRLRGANLNEVGSGGVTGTPASLPAGWEFVDGYLVGAGADLYAAQLSGADLTGACLLYTSRCV